MNYIRQELSIKKVPKEKIPTLIMIGIWCCVIVGVGVATGLLNRWPLSLAAMFYFMWGGDVRKVPSIMSGATIGILMAAFLALFIRWFREDIGYFWSVMLPLIFIIFIIVFGKQKVNYFINNATSAFLIVCCISLETILTNWWWYIMMAIVGGGIRMAGYFLIVKFRSAQVKRKLEKECPVCPEEAVAEESAELANARERIVDPIRPRLSAQEAEMIDEEAVLKDQEEALFEREERLNEKEEQLREKEKLLAQREEQLLKHEAKKGKPKIA